MSRHLLTGMIALACAACASDSRDPDAPPPGPTTKVPLVVVGLVFAPRNADQLASETAALVSAFRAAGFKAQIAGTGTGAGTPDAGTTGGPPYLGISMDHNEEYCLAGVARVRNATPDPDIHFEVRQRSEPGLTQFECAKSIVSKIMLRVKPQ